MFDLKNFTKSVRPKGLTHLGAKLAAQHIEPTAPAPRFVLIALSYRNRVPLQPLVQVGDEVALGQCLAKSSAPGPSQVLAPVHASVSGVVRDVLNCAVPGPTHARMPCVLIENDFEDRRVLLEPLDCSASSDALSDRIEQAGIVGMGGAGFLSSLKIKNTQQANYLLINGAECEPEISCDDALMRLFAEHILKGAEVVMKVLGIKKVFFCIEEDKKEAIVSVQRLLDDKPWCVLCTVPDIYPGGGEKQLLHFVLGKEVPSGAFLSDIGVICFNVATLKAVCDGVFFGQPLVERMVTLAGKGFEKPQNHMFRMGTLLTDLLEKGGVNNNNASIVMGGPMMGVEIGQVGSKALENIAVTKTSNCFLAIEKENTKQMPCIRCGDCVKVCPVNLLPQQLYWFAKSDNHNKLEEHGLFDCIECGACAYVCPSKIPLVWYYRYAKESIMLEKASKQKSDVARLRHENRILRLEREKREREEKMAAKRAQMKKNKQNKQLIQEAQERLKTSGHTSEKN